MSAVLLVSALMVSLEVGMLSSPSHDDLMAADARDILYRKAKFGIGQFEQTMPPGHAAGYISGSFLVRSYLAIVMHLATIGLGCGLYLGITVFRALGHTDEQIKVEQRWTLTGCIVGMIVFMFVGNILMFLMIASFVQVKWPLYGASSNFDHATGTMVEIAYNPTRGAVMDNTTIAFSAVGGILMALGVVAPLTAAVCVGRLGGKRSMSKMSETRQEV